ncbi:MAG: hypothetical protein L0211_14030 [Planctomycetaceae bacterium]|nr:hypothetical protein [Planctomycetaceae bacterium]
MRTASHQFGLADLLWFLFGTAAFLSAWTPHNPLGGLSSAALLAVFYWRVQAYDVFMLHCLYAGVGLAAAAIVLGTSACGLYWPEAGTCAWWTVQASSLTATLISFAVYLLAMLARDV